MGKRKYARSPLVSVHLKRRDYERLVQFKGQLETLAGKTVTMGDTVAALVWAVLR